MRPVIVTLAVIATTHPWLAIVSIPRPARLGLKTDLACLRHGWDRLLPQTFSYRTVSAKVPDVRRASLGNPLVYT